MVGLEEGFQNLEVVSWSLRIENHHSGSNFEVYRIVKSIYNDLLLRLKDLLKVRLDGRTRDDSLREESERQTRINNTTSSKFWEFDS